MVLKVCRRVREAELRGVEDMRMKALILGDADNPIQSDEVLLHSLTLTSTTFKPHTSPSPHLLPTSISALKSLHLSNLGIPHPCTHLHTLLSSCPHLESLTISALRDLMPNQLREAFEGLQWKERLRMLRLEQFEPGQVEAVPFIMASLPCLSSLHISFPLSSETLSFLPSSLRILSFGPGIITCDYRSTITVDLDSVLIRHLRVRKEGLEEIRIVTLRTGKGVDASWARYTTTWIRTMLERGGVDEERMGIKVMEVQMGNVV